MEENSGSGTSNIENNEEYPSKEKEEGPGHATDVPHVPHVPHVSHVSQISNNKYDNGTREDEGMRL